MSNTRPAAVLSVSLHTIAYPLSLLLGHLQGTSLDSRGVLARNLDSGRGSLVSQEDMSSLFDHYFGREQDIGHLIHREVSRWGLFEQEVQIYGSMIAPCRGAVRNFSGDT